MIKKDEKNKPEPRNNINVKRKNLIPAWS